MMRVALVPVRSILVLCFYFVCLQLLARKAAQSSLYSLQCASPLFPCNKKLCVFAEVQQLMQGHRMNSIRDNKGMQG